MTSDVRVGRHPPIGRHRELAQVEAFLDALSQGNAGALAITGDAGIGKTTLWRESVRLARALGYLVLTARPTGAETRLSFSGLADLLESVPESAFATLPDVQRDALDGALLRRITVPSGFGARVVATAVLSVLRELTKLRTVLVAVEDAQWLDSATGEALSFALRRVEELPIGTLISVRTEAARPATFEQALPLELRTDLGLGPLSTAAIHDVIEREVGRSVPRPLAVQIATASGGNAMYALEIARELERTGVPKPGVALHPPGQLMALIRARVSRLPAHTREELLTAASLSQPTLSLVDGAALGPAEKQGIVVVDERGRIAFTHPLLAAAVYESASSAKRRTIHRELAERVVDAEERARHLGLATESPDETVAAELDRAALHAAARGASAAATELERRALELTEDPRGEAAVVRMLSVTRSLTVAGQTEAALEMLEMSLDFGLSGDLLAQVLYRLGDMSWYARDFSRGYQYLVRALEIARDPLLIGRIHNEAAWISEQIDLARAIRHEDAVLALLEPGPGPYSYALMYRAYLRLIDGQGADHDAIDRAMSMGKPVDPDDASPVPFVWAMFTDNFDAARAQLLAGISEATASGEETYMQTFLGHLAAIECWTGHWSLADEYAARSIELTERIPSEAFLGSAMFARGYVDAHIGRTADARAAGEQIVQLFAGRAEPQLVFGHWLLGFTALVEHDYAGAYKHLGIAAETVDQTGQREPVRFRFHPDLVEAAIAVGELERAEQLIVRLEERGRVFPRPWILATTARCRGLLLSARGDLDGAAAAMSKALRHHEKLDMPFERARTLLATSQLLRRRREKREARAALDEALDEFRRLGAQAWIERCDAELARIPIRRSSETLSPTEQEIARLAAAGLTNRQIAERAFISPKTVEANIARIYRKLDISSRAELGRMMANQGQAVET